MLEEDIWSHFGQWGAVAVWIGIYAVFLLFIPFYKKSQLKPAGTYIAFVVAFALEMFGIPFSMYAIGWAFGYTLPEGVFWGHTLGSYIGLSGMYIGLIVSLIGLGLVVVGWRQIHKGYWSKEEGQGQADHLWHLLTLGLHGLQDLPGHLGMMLEWATLPLVVLYALLLVMLPAVGRRKKDTVMEEFGSGTRSRARTKMFIPGWSETTGHKLIPGPCPRHPSFSLRKPRTAAGNSSSLSRWCMCKAPLNSTTLE